MKRPKSTFIFGLLFAMVFGLGGIFIPSLNQTVSASALTAEESSIFTFTPTSENECSVRLTDKTVDRAIVPTTAIINNVEYDVTAIAANGFANSKNLEKVWLPSSIKTIGASAFMSCSKLSSLTLSAVETIGGNAFAMTNLDYLILPETVTSVAATILRSCSTPVYVRASEEDLANYSWHANWNGSNSGTVEYASEFVPPIQYRYVQNVASEQAISMFGITPYAETEDGYVVDSYQPFVTENGVDIYIPAVYNDLPVIGIADAAFLFNTLNSITIAYADTPIRIGTNAFYAFEGTTITINREVVFEDDYGDPAEFVFASTLASTVVLPNTITELGNSAFQDCYGLTDIHFVEPKELTQAEEMALAGSLESTQKVTLPETVTTLGSEAFSGVTNILELTIPNSVENVGANAFVGWDEPQVINVSYDSEEDLGEGWNSLWNGSCNKSIIEYAKPQIFEITYNLNGGSHAGNPETYTPKDSVILADATRTGYKFDGWFDESGVKVSEIAVGTVGNITLEARWTANTYKITYDSNKPTNASAEIVGATGDSNHTYDLAGSLTPNGYSLAGWIFNGWKDADGNSYNDGASVLNWTENDEDTITLYAQWVAQNYLVTYHDNRPGTASEAVMGTMDYTAHTYDTASQIRVNSFTLKGWTFTGWKDAEGKDYVDGQYISTVSQGGTIALFAQWVQNTYTIVYDNNKPSNATNSTTGSMNNTVCSYDSTLALRSNVFSLNGWIFNGWNSEANGTGTSYTDEQDVSNLTTANNSVIVLYAQWIPYTYTVNYISNGGTGTMEDSTHTYDVAKKLNESTFYKKGYHVNKWSTEADGSGLSYTTDENVVNLTNINGGNVTLYAQWAPNIYTIIYDGNGATGGYTEPTQQEYDAPMNIRENGFVKEGYVFTGWKLADGTWPMFADPYPNPNPKPHVYNFVESGSVTVYAQWDIFYYSIELRGWCPHDQRIPFNTVRKKLGQDQSYSYTAQERCGIKQGMNSIVCGYVFSHWEITEGPGMTLGKYSEDRTLTVKNLTNKYGILVKFTAVYKEPPPSCVAEGTMVTLADGSQKAVETLDGTEQLLVWNLETGKFDSAPILFVDSDPLREYNIIHLYFEDGTEVKVIDDHAFWDFDLNQYVFMRADAAQYIGHSFNKQTTTEEGLTWISVKLVDVKVYKEVTTAWSPITYKHLALYVNGMLSMPGGTEGFINIFEVDAETMKYDQEAMNADIEEYGLFTYEDFADLIPEYVFEAFNGQYLKVSIGKGLIEWHDIEHLIARYSKFF